jgi:hypothetical protein
VEINIIYIEGNCIAEIISDSIEIKNTQDVLDIMADCSYQGAGSMILYEKNIISEFFDLKTGIAGDILQKFSTYQMRLAIIGDFSKYPGKSLRDFIFESNRYRRINFVKSREEAITALSMNKLQNNK